MDKTTHEVMCTSSNISLTHTKYECSMILSLLYIILISYYIVCRFHAEKFGKLVPELL
jgi:hypothetical protein